MIPIKLTSFLCKMSYHIDVDMLSSKLSLMNLNRQNLDTIIQKGTRRYVDETKENVDLSKLHAQIAKILVQGCDSHFEDIQNIKLLPIMGVSDHATADEDLLELAKLDKTTKVAKDGNFELRLDKAQTCEHPIVIHSASQDHSALISLLHEFDIRSDKHKLKKHLQTIDPPTVKRLVTEIEKLSPGFVANFVMVDGVFKNSKTCSATKLDRVNGLYKFLKKVQF